MATPRVLRLAQRRHPHRAVQVQAAARVLPVRRARRSRVRRGEPVRGGVERALREQSAAGGSAVVAAVLTQEGYVAEGRVATVTACAIARAVSSVRSVPSARGVCSRSLLDCSLYR